MRPDRLTRHRAPPRVPDSYAAVQLEKLERTRVQPSVLSLPTQNPSDRRRSTTAPDRG